MIAPQAPKTAKKKLGLKERYALQTRGLDWEPTYQPVEKIFPLETFEGIKIHDWDAWQDPFRLTMDAYWKYQAEKERKLYAVIDSFAQNNGHLGITDARYINAIKLFLTGVSPLEYAAHRGFAHVGRHFRGVGARVACQMQAIDELRHAQTQMHAVSHYNKFFDGLHDPTYMHDRVWFLSVPKSFFDDARTAGPFEFVTAISFSFEFVLTNLLFVPFMSGAAYNGDMATVTFGFSAQSDEARHMTLGLETIKFILEQDEANVPIVQHWIDKWFWRGYRLLALVVDDDGLHAAQTGHVMARSLGDVLRGERRRAVRGPQPLRHPAAQVSRGCTKGEEPAVARIWSDLLQLHARGAHPHVDPVG